MLVEHSFIKEAELRRSDMSPLTGFKYIQKYFLLTFRSYGAFKPA
jgi:hypothetical protein